MGNVSHVYISPKCENAQAIGTSRKTSLNRGIIMNISIDKNNSVPTYLQITEQIKEKIMRRCQRE
jgi:hypothetical protein